LLPGEGLQTGYLGLEEGFLFPGAHPGVQHGAGPGLGLDWLGLQGKKLLDLVPAVPPATPGGADGMQQPPLLPGVQGVAVEAVALSHLLGGEEKQIHNKL